MIIMSANTIQSHRHFSTLCVTSTLCTTQLGRITKRLAGSGGKGFQKFRGPGNVN